jgi:hypothetical protein
MTTERKEKWTPGPYAAKPETPYVAAQVWSDGLIIADVYGESCEATQASAKLFAAPPELFEALVAIESCLPPDDNDHAAQKVRAAIAKARGGQ